MKPFFTYTYLVDKKTIFIGVMVSFFGSYLMAVDYALPSHDEIKKEVNLLIELNRSKRSNATVLQKVKNAITLSGYTEITRENAPSIYKLIDAAAMAVGVDVTSKVYLELCSPNPFDFDVTKIGKNAIRLGGIGKETYLFIGSKLLCELTPAETKAFLEYKFIFIKDDYFKKLESYQFEIVKAYMYFCGFTCLYVIYLFISWELIPAEYEKTKVVFEIVCSSLFAAPMAAILFDLVQKSDFARKIEQHANLCVTSREDLLSGLKKVAAMAMVEKLKKDPSKIDKKLFSMAEQEMQDIIIKYIDNGKIDIY